jgi:hypothetical protein
MAVGTSGVLPCIAIVEPSVVVEEPSVRVIGLSDEVCVPIAGYANSHPKVVGREVNLWL